MRAVGKQLLEGAKSLLLLLFTAQRSEVERPSGSKARLQSSRPTLAPTIPSFPKLHSHLGATYSNKWRTLYI